MKLRDALRVRLALRFYVVGLAQLAILAAGFFVFSELNRPAVAAPCEDAVRFVHHVVEGALDEPPRGIWEPGGRPDGRGERVEQMSVWPGSPIGGGRALAFVFVVVGVSSWFMARTLTRPLDRLASAARAFGAGDLKARAALPNRDELGEVSRAFDEMADRMTERLRAEREVLANVSHELRTPLARIRVALEIVSEKEGDVAALRNMLGEIAIDLDELEGLISDVVLAARLSVEDASTPAGFPLRRRRVDVSELLKCAASRFCSLHANRPLLIYVSEDMPMVDADPVLLRRVFDNLLENAHKYTEHPTEPIELVARSGEGLIVDVIDHGVGIGAEDLLCVFRPFYRANNRRGAGGLGLGLPLAKRIVEAHGGEIELFSTPNQGTRARVRLPIAQENHAARQ